MNSLDVIGWIALAPMLVITLAQWLRFDRQPHLAALLSLTPYLLVLAVPLAVIAALDGRTVVAVAALFPLGTLVWLALPILFRPDADPDAVPFMRLGCVNLMGDNRTPHQAGASLSDHEADVWVLVEATPTMSRAFIDALGRPDLHRCDLLDEGTNGMSVWSRFPIVSGGPSEVTGRRTIDLVLQPHDAPAVRVVAVHPRPPTQTATGWSDELRRLGEHTVEPEIPTVIAGDFNACRWHPTFRRLLRRGWRDAHEVVGQGWAATWPAHRGVLPPPFVLLDHALVGHGLGASRVDEVRVPGSDHRGFVATLTVNLTAR